MSVNEVEVKIILDERTDFPLLDIPGLDLFVSWLPLTRIQLELFLSDINDARFGADWYTKRICTNNPRVSPGHLNNTNMSGALATNILFPEARRITQWFGPEYDLPTVEQWKKILNACRACSVQSVDNVPDNIDPRAKTLLMRLNDVVQPKTLADQMLFFYGISEYLYNGPQNCSATDGRIGEVQNFAKKFLKDGSRKENRTFRLIKKRLKGKNNAENNCG